MDIDDVVPFIPAGTEEPKGAATYDSHPATLPLPVFCHASLPKTRD